jgi:hypothetical protein
MPSPFGVFDATDSAAHTQGARAANDIGKDWTQDFTIA